MRPRLPTAQQLLPFLRIIDENRIYSNFGPLNEKLQTQLADKHREWFGTRPDVVSTSNGTSAIEILLQTLNLPPGSKILIPALTFVATCTAVQRMGYLPVVVDVDADSWLMTTESVRGVDLTGVSAAVPVATFGAPQDVAAWGEWSARTGVKVIIDAAAGFGSQDVAPGVSATFSLHATKSLGAAEGGFIMTLDSSQAQTAKKLTNFGIPDLRLLVGTNAKLSEYHAAIALVALENWGDVVERRSLVRRHYLECLSRYIDSNTLAVQKPHAKIPSVFLVRFATEGARERCRQLCEELGVGTRSWYTPLIHRHPAISGIACGSDLKHASHLADRLLGLPFYPDLSFDDVEYVASIVGRACEDG